MYKPSIYIYLIFIVFLIKMVKDGYWKGIFSGIVNRIKENYTSTLIIIVIGTVLLFLDKRINSYMVYHKRDYYDKIAGFFYQFGKGEILFSILLVLIIVFMIIKKRRLYIIFTISLMSSVYSGIIVNILKWFFSRERPFVGNNPFKFFAYITAYQKGDLFNYPYMSMPSGHTITIFAAVIPLFFYFKNKIIRVFLALLALFIALSRIYLNEHWVSDVYFGAVLGLVIGSVMYYNNKKKLKIENQIS